MKTFISTLAIASSLFIAANASAVTLYEDGVSTTDGLTLSDLAADGWSELYNDFYRAGNSQAQLLEFQALAGSAYVFVGAINLAGDVIVGATGLASEVLSIGGTSSAAVSHSSSNLYWYNVQGLSFGFTPTQNVSLGSADTTSDALNPLRLSWHSHGVDSVGGWRAGETRWLNGSTDYRKIILVGDPSTQAVPDTGSSLALLGLALVGFIAVRRKVA